MTATNHVLTGALLGFAIQQPIIAIPLAVASHFVLDALPHYGNKNLASRRFKLILGADMLCAGLVLIVLMLLQPAYWQLAVVCGIAGASPDLMWLPGWLRLIYSVPKRKLNGIMLFHKNIQWAERAAHYPLEVLWATGCIATLVKLI